MLDSIHAQYRTIFNSNILRMIKSWISFITLFLPKWKFEKKLALKYQNCQRYYGNLGKLGKLLVVGKHLMSGNS